MQNFKRIIDPSEMLETNLKIQYIINLLHGEELFHYDTLCDQVEITTMAHLNQLILGLGTYFFL